MPTIYFGRARETFSGVLTVDRLVAVIDAWLFFRRREPDDGREGIVACTVSPHRARGVAR
jgi:hypothetical protein